MARKHGRTAPYEIMRQVAGSKPSPSSLDSSRTASPPSSTTAKRRQTGFFKKLKKTCAVTSHTPDAAAIQEAGGGSESAAGWLGRVAAAWRAVRSPVALRLPRLAVGGLALGLLLTFTAVYWVGSQVGHRAALADGGTAEAAGRVSQNGVVQGDYSTYGDKHLAMASPNPAEAPGGAIDLPTVDPRLAGNNYLRLVSLRGVDIDEARRIQKFFQQAGVATILTGSKLFDPAQGKTPEGWISVVDVTRGFTREEWYNGEHEPYYTARRALGRAWKAHNRGVGSDLNTMMFYKFTPDVD